MLPVEEGCWFEQHSCCYCGVNFAKTISLSNPITSTQHGPSTNARRLTHHLNQAGGALRCVGRGLTICFAPVARLYTPPCYNDNRLEYFMAPPSRRIADTPRLTIYICTTGFKCTAGQNHYYFSYL